MAENKLAGKNYQGTIAGGQGPVLGQEKVSTGEDSTLHGGELGKHISLSSLGGNDSKPTGGAPNFDLHGKSYAGPQNWQPTNKGIVNPDDVVRG